MHDWLKEYHPDFLHTSPKTVYNFVMALRQKYNIPLEEIGREYFAVEELPYGQQAQADFGHYTLQGSEESRKRIHFFVMMLSRSRMKFVQFSDYPFTTRTAIEAHEEAFRFFCGIPSEVVYDQDRLFLVEERMGELLLTKDFKDYVFEQKFQLHFCRKADPQSKGKVENVVKYVKNNFLYARPWHDLQTLKDISRSALADYRKLYKAHLLVIDDIMMFPVTQPDAVSFFNLINELHDRTSIVITTNKSPKEWADVLQASVLTTDLLDRILYRC